MSINAPLWLGYPWYASGTATLLGEITTYVKSKSGKISKGGNALDFSVCSGKWSTIRKMNGLNKEDGAIFWDWIKPECRKVFESEYSPPTEKESMDDVTSIDSMESNESESSIEDIEVIDDTNDDKTD